MPNASVSEKVYQGHSGSGVANSASRGGRSVAVRGVDTGSYYDWSVSQLKKRAKELGMSGYSALTKEDLIFKLRYR
ncbi:MAG TPA: Rho termination factor N-terminal domain-containing protein [Mycobacterium sp.]